MEVLLANVKSKILTMEDNNRKQDLNSNDSGSTDKQSCTQGSKSGQQYNTSNDFSDSPMRTGQTTGGGEDGNWKLTPEVQEQDDNSSSSDKR